MRRGGCSKAKAERIHAKRRAFERYGLELNRDQLDEMARMIQRGKAILLRTRSHRVSTYELNAFGQTFAVAYDKNRKTIVTFLPLCYLDKFRANRRQQWALQIARL